MRPYKKIFVASILVTVVLFCYDYKYDSSHNLTGRQMAFEIVVWGSLYVIAIFIVASALYFIYSKIRQLLGGGERRNK